MTSKLKSVRETENTTRIYIVGAHSTGKTTLVKEVAKHYDLPLIPEAARIVLEENGWTLENVRLNPYRAYSFQLEISARQGCLEMEHKSFVSDRGVDHLVYAAFYSDASTSIEQSSIFSSQIERMSKSHVFLVTPHKELIKEDGVRLDCTWDGVMKIHNAIEFYLRLKAIPFVPLHEMSMVSRLATVKAVVGGAK